ncbi:hypothetical protein CR513_31392, partial [Mucuna pruriens]
MDSCAVQFSLSPPATTKVPLNYKDFGGFAASACSVRPWAGVNFTLQNYHNAPDKNKQTNSQTLIMRHSLTIIHPYACVPLHGHHNLINSFILEVTQRMQPVHIL